MKRKFFNFLIIAILTIIFIAGCFAKKVTIQEILANPIIEEGSLVTVRGKVLNPTQQYPGTTRGYFSLQDDDGNEVIVKTKKLPAPGVKKTVTGYVNVSPVDGSITIKEETPSTLILIYAILAFIIVLVILLWLFFGGIIDHRHPEPGIYMMVSDIPQISFRITLSPESGLQNALPTIIFYPLSHGNFVDIGTGKNCFIKIVEPGRIKTISSKHARFSLDPQSNEFKIMSLTNAVTKVNDDVINYGESHSLKNGDLITLGNVMIRLSYDV